MKDIIAICDREERYLYHLVEYLEKKEVFPFIIHAFTNYETLYDYLLRNQINFLLISEEMFREDIFSCYGGKLLILNETGKIKEREEIHINKYQSSENIYQMIMNNCMEDIGPLPQNSPGTNFSKIIGFYTPVQRCLQTSFSLCLGQLLAKNAKVLYVNLESYSGFHTLTGNPSTGDITDVLYYLTCDKEKLSYKLSSMICSIKELEYIVPFPVGRNIGDIEGDIWKDLIFFLSKMTEYEYIIFDLGEQVQNLFEILSLCNYIFTINRQDAYSRAKQKQYEELLKIKNCEDLLLKTKKLDLPVFHYLSEDLNQLSHGELAAYVKNIIREENM